MKPLLPLLISLLLLLFPALALAEGTPPDPLRQPESQSPYGMDIMGPAWQWTFPREEAWPRMSGEIRIDQLDEIMRKSAAAGVRAARISTWWCMIEPQRDQYFWTDMDYAFQLARNYGIVPVPEVFFTPAWATLAGPNDAECINSTVKNYPPTDMTEWSQFMSDLVARYGRQGKDQVHDWEIWNEPDLWEFLYVPHDPDNGSVPVYADLVKRARQEIDAHDPGGRLLLGGLSDIYGPAFLEKLLNLRGPLDIRDDVDVVTFHAFSAHEEKISKLKAPLAGTNYELWITELNHWGWSEDTSSAALAELYQRLRNHGITRSFWFKSWTTDWGPGIFVNRDPLWVPGPFESSAFYTTFEQQAFGHTLPAAPIPEWPPSHSLVGAQPFLAWHAPQAGDFPISGYKLQIDDSLFRGQPYFHTPEVDAWIPATLIHFFPLQRAGSQPVAGTRLAASPASPLVVPALERSHFSPDRELPPGRYFWRLAAVDSEGNVGPYSPVQTILVEAGSQRAFLPLLKVAP